MRSLFILFQVSIPLIVNWKKNIKRNQISWVETAVLEVVQHSVEYPTVALLEYAPNPETHEGSLQTEAVINVEEGVSCLGNTGHSQYT